MIILLQCPPCRKLWVDEIVYFYSPNSDMEMLNFNKNPQEEMNTSVFTKPEDQISDSGTGPGTDQVISSDVIPTSAGGVFHNPPVGRK